MKRLKVASSVSLDRDKPALDWSTCVFCQGGRGLAKGDLVCPGKNAIASKRVGCYAAVAGYLEQLKKYPTHRLPSGRPVIDFDDGCGIEAAFVENLAKWHKGCVKAYQSPKVEELLSQLAAEEELLSPPRSTASLPDSSRATRSASRTIPAKSEVCFLCGQPGTRVRPLHQCETKELENRVKKCATDLGDTELLSQIITYGDLVAQEAKYHVQCLVRLYSQCRSKACKSQADVDFLMCEGMAFADLISYISMKLLESKSNVFKMGDLKRLYDSRVEDLSGCAHDTHTTRLRERILARMPDLQEQISGREYVLMHNKANILMNIEREDMDDDAVGFHRFVRSLRKCMNEARSYFSGEFPARCEETSVPAPLLTAVTWMLYGSTSQQACGATRPALTIAQLILLNFRMSMPKGDIVRHSKCREPPFPLYASLFTYGYSRNKEMISELHRLGIGVSYSRIMEVTSQLSRLVVKRAQEGVLCPSQLKKRMFTVVAYDNFDLKHTSNTSGEEFHGTGISVMQMCAENDNPENRSFQTSFADVEQRGNKSVPLLPEHYTTMDDSFVLPEKVEMIPLNPPTTSEIFHAMRPANNFCKTWKLEEGWFMYVHGQFSEINHCSDFSWSAYHADRETGKVVPGIGAILPLFEDKSTAPHMLKHGMDLSKSITQHLNPGQPTVLCMDQQLYAIAKRLQWHRPALYGEDRIVMLLGGFHTEKAFLGVIGNMLEKSGWVHIISASGVTSAGKAEAALKVNHVVRSRVLYQKTAAALYSLLIDAYEECNPDHVLSLDEWISIQKGHSPTFYYWFLVLNLITLLLTFVRALRTRDYDLFLRCIPEMLQWFFVFDHQNYSRWLSVHLKDLIELQHKAPQIYQAFKAGNFVFNGTGNAFSCLPIDQKHEQHNADLKDKGGVVGLAHNPGSLRRVVLVGPELARLTREFQNVEKSTGGKHHEQYFGYQHRFKVHTSALKDSFLTLQNPFTELGSDLISLDTREAVCPEDVKVLFSLEQMAREKYTDFVDRCIKSNESSVYHTIHKSGVKIFASKKRPLHPSRLQEKVLQLKEEAYLHWRMYVTSVARKLNMDVFFSHENQHYPPALSVRGQLRPGIKADLVKILENLVTEKREPSHCGGLVIDGASLVHQVPPRGGTKVFSEYLKAQLIPHVRQMALSVGATRVDLVWDLYSERSVKSVERESRGSGVRRKDLPEKGSIPKDWSDYLRHDLNKTDLFKYLAAGFVTETTGLKIVSNVSKEIKTAGLPSTMLLSQHCDVMEEADPRIISHLQDMVKEGAKSVMVRATDTDVVVLAVSCFYELGDQGLQELWMRYGSGKTARNISVHDICRILGRNKAEALRGFHAFTGCDTTSYLSGIGKTKAWKLWQTHPEATAAFTALGQPSVALPSDVLDALDRFTVLLYDVNGEETSVNGVRRRLYVEEGRSIYMIPPTAAALTQHTLRAAYQAGHLWGKALHAVPEPNPDATSWGWEISVNGISPYWTQLPHVWAACRELHICSCKTSCGTMRCGCRKNNLPCCSGCSVCHGKCQNKSTPEGPTGAVATRIEEEEAEEAIFEL